MSFGGLGELEIGDRVTTSQLLLAAVGDQAVEGIPMDGLEQPEPDPAAGQSSGITDRRLVARDQAVLREREEPVERVAMCAVAGVDDPLGLVDVEATLEDGRAHGTWRVPRPSAGRGSSRSHPRASAGAPGRRAVPNRATAGAPRAGRGSRPAAEATAGRRPARCRAATRRAARRSRPRSAGRAPAPSPAGPPARDR